MSVIVGKPKFENPTTGLHPGVCCDAEDLGLQETAFGKKHKVRLSWQIAELKKDGKPFVISRRYTASLDRRASLRKDLEAWRGKAFSDQEAERFDLENLLNVPCALQLVEQPGKDGDVFVNIATVLPLPKGFELLKVSPDYVRVKDRPANGEPVETSEAPPEDNRPPF